MSHLISISAVCKQQLSSLALKELHAIDFLVLFNNHALVTVDLDITIQIPCYLETVGTLFSLECEKIIQIAKSAFRRLS